jgi:Protein of unknown function (DUF2934)
LTKTETAVNDRNLEQRIREHAYQIWVSEGRPQGRAEAHWEMARELVAIEDSQRSATKPNPGTAERDRNLGGTEPVEPIEAIENQGEFPTLADQGEERTRPTRRQRRRSR